MLPFLKEKSRPAEVSLSRTGMDAAPGEDPSRPMGERPIWRAGGIPAQAGSCGPASIRKG